MDFKNSNQRAVKRFLCSFKYAWDGIVHALTHEQNIRIQFFIGTFIMVLSYLLEISRSEKLILFIVIGVVISLELVNTAIERIIDLVSPEYHPIAKLAKDVSAGAVLTFSLFSFFIGIYIFYSPIIEFLSRFRL